MLSRFSSREEIPLLQSQVMRAIAEVELYLTLFISSGGGT
jgi:hypothetical protein